VKCRPQNTLFLLPDVPSKICHSRWPATLPSGVSRPCLKVHAFPSYSLYKEPRRIDDEHIADFYCPWKPCTHAANTDNATAAARHWLDSATTFFGKPFVEPKYISTASLRYLSLFIRDRGILKLCWWKFRVCTISPEAVVFPDLQQTGPKKKKKSFNTTCKWASYLLSEAPVESVFAMTPQFSTIEIYSRFRVDSFTGNMLSNYGSAKHALGVNSSLSRSVSLFVTSRSKHW
jgi:hypothetical protein